MRQIGSLRAREHVKTLRDQQRCERTKRVERGVDAAEAEAEAEAGRVGGLVDEGLEEGRLCR